MMPTIARKVVRKKVRTPVVRANKRLAKNPNSPTGTPKSLRLGEVAPLAGISFCREVIVAPPPNALRSVWFPVWFPVCVPGEKRSQARILGYGSSRPDRTVAGVDRGATNADSAIRKPDVLCDVRRHAHIAAGVGRGRPGGSRYHCRRIDPARLLLRSPCHRRDGGDDGGPELYRCSGRS